MTDDLSKTNLILDTIAEYMKAEYEGGDKKSLLLTL
jgi:hypothetical protein